MRVKRGRKDHVHVKQTDLGPVKVTRWGEQREVVKIPKLQFTSSSES